MPAEHDIEYIDYDDDPADTAARAWAYRTPVGRKCLRLARSGSEDAVLRAFRTGYLQAHRVEATGGEG